MEPLTIATQRIDTHISRLASAFDPESVVKSELVMELVRADGGPATAAPRRTWVRRLLGALTPTPPPPPPGETTELVAAALRRAAAHVAPRPVRLAVGGYFSSGKSSLINVLIGTSLLPASDYPETGVPCVLTSGRANRAVVHTVRGTKKIRFTAEAIASYVSATGANGAWRDAIRDVVEVRITLNSGVIPADATWIDSPGINDGRSDPRFRELPAELARGSDVLVFVVPHMPVFGLKEAAFVAAHIAEAGPASIVFVLNVRLSADTEREWKKFLAQRHSYEKQITQKIDTGSVPARIVAISVQAAAGDPAGFGGDSVGALFTELSDPAAPRVAATRLFRAVRELRDLMQQLDARIAAEESRVAAADAALVAVQRDRARQHQEFVRAVRAPVLTDLNARSRVPEHWADHVVKNELMKPGPLQPSEHYGNAFDDLLGSAMNRIANEVAAAINRIASQHRHAPLGGSGQSAISGALRPESAYVYGFRPVSDRTFGQKVSDWWNEKERQRDAIKRQLSYAASDAAGTMLKSIDKIVEASDRYCGLADPEPSPPNLTRLHALRNARRLLERDAAEPLQRALSVAQARARA